MTEPPQPPAKGQWESAEATQTLLGAEVQSERLEVLIVGQASFVRHPVGDTQRVRIGRSQKADARVDEHSISRQHAILHIDNHDGREPPTIEIEDVGSSNGTRVRGARLEVGNRVQIKVGEVVDLGKTMLIVQRSSTAERPQRLWTHGYFEVRLEEECARAQSTGARFSVVRLKSESPSQPHLQGVLTGSLRPFDLVAPYAPGEYEVLLVDAGSEQSAEWLSTLQARLAELGCKIRVGRALFPDDGRSPEGLAAVAGARLRGESVVDPGAERIEVFADDAMKQLERLVDRVAPSDISVLVLGETGVGKEVIAEEIHRRSTRSGQPLLRLNCAALSPTLLESELFGHERGAFTGAVRAKPGLLETAEGGTVLLDEVGELPLETQVKLLRVIEERKVLRVGSVEPRTIDVRFVSATNRDLESAIVDGSFRSDLYYRLSGISLMIPPLRERHDAIEGLARTLSTKAHGRFGYTTPGQFTPEAMALLRSYYWPGNIRELKNIVDRAVLLAGGEPIGVDHLPGEKLTTSVLGTRTSRVAPSVPPEATAEGGNEDPTLDSMDTADIGPLRDSFATNLKKEIESLEKTRIVEALEQCAGNQTQAAKMLGISRRTLLYRLDLYGIPRPRKSNRQA